MLTLVIYIVLAIILVMLLYVARNFELVSGHEEVEEDSRIGFTKILMYVAIIVVIIAILVHTYFAVKGTPWESHLLEWLNIIVRLMHITFGIAWIGASFYFVFLENALKIQLSAPFYPLFSFFPTRTLALTLSHKLIIFSVYRDLFGIMNGRKADLHKWE